MARDSIDMELAPLFHALADPTRVRVVEALGEGPRKAGELATLTGVSAPSMSRHLRVLLEAGLVEDERPRDDARTRVFHLRPVSDEQMVSSDVEVAVDPETAFAVFTDEVDLWIVRGPINMHYATRPSAFR